MRKLFLTAVALGSVSLMPIMAQQTEALNGNFSTKVSYAKGKNAYLMDSCKVNFTIKRIVGRAGLSAHAVWTANPEFTYNKVNVKKSSLSAARYEDMAQRYDLITPEKASFEVVLMFYREESKSYFASAKCNITIDNLEKAGAKVSPETFEISDWSDLFTDVVVGKQTAEKPGTVITDATMKEFFKASRIERDGIEGKLDPSSRGYNFRLRNILSYADRVDVVSIKTNSIVWNEDEYAYMIDEISRRKKSLDFLAKGDTANSDAAYYSNRKYPTTVSMSSPNFWNTTSMSSDTYFSYLDKADKYYQDKKWNEAGVYYNMAAAIDSTIKYPMKQVEKINDYIAYKNNRNITGVMDLVYVEGNGQVKSFYIGKTEVTQRQWRRVMGSTPSSFSGCPDCPVENITYDEAMEFLKKLSEQTGMTYRLPTLAEWEYAAKGGKSGSQTMFSGSDNIDAVAWSAYNSEQTSHAVGTKEPNELGVYDMSGNVSEWMSDAYGKTRFVRGGSFADDASGCTTTSKETVTNTTKSKKIGFRVCQSE